MPILQWLNREESSKETARVPHRLLQADPKSSYGDENTEHMLIQGDNLDAPKALLPYDMPKGAKFPGTFAFGSNKEKERIGKVWAEKSGNLFLMA
ncbi:MAG: hypothetical protein QNJ27_01780 [Simkaniaceae bacterium]|nr:hypothetical protein [Simkaniaceae bacterium]